MQLVLHLSPNSITITSVAGTGAYPLLEGIGTMRLAVRAGTPVGLGVGETGSVAVYLENSRKQASRILGRPLRVRAELLEDDGSPIFEGRISSCTLGQLMALEVEP